VTSVRVLDQLGVVTSRRRELAHRFGAGLDVTLYWNAGAELVTVEVLDLAAGENFELAVPRSQALDAFHHPFAYVASCAGGKPPSASLRDR
jgi:hypothetical protein